MTPVAVGEVTVGAVAAPALARRPISVCAYGFSACGLVKFQSQLMPAFCAMFWPVLPERVAAPPRRFCRELVQRRSATTVSTEPLVRRFAVLPALAIAIVPNIASRVAVRLSTNDALLAEVFWVLSAPGKNGLSWSTPVNVAAPAMAGAPPATRTMSSAVPTLGPASAQISERAPSAAASS